MSMAPKIENSCFCENLELLENQYTGLYWPAQ